MGDVATPNTLGDILELDQKMRSAAEHCIVTCNSSSTRKVS
jgi:hypothetical protein